MLDMTAPREAMYVEDWFRIGALSFETATRWHLLETRRNVIPGNAYDEARNALIGAILEELETNYSREFVFDDKTTKFRRK